MKESQFKSEFKKGLEFYNPGILIRCISDRFVRGISDLLIWYMGSSMAIELKYLPSIPARPRTAEMLNHPFSDNQVGFLISMLSTGNSALGVVGIDKDAYIIHPNYIASSKGQVLYADLASFPRLSKGRGTPWPATLTVEEFNGVSTLALPGQK